MDQNTAMCQFLDEVKVGEGTAGDGAPRCGADDLADGDAGWPSERRRSLLFLDQLFGRLVSKFCQETTI